MRRGTRRRLVRVESPMLVDQHSTDAAPGIWSAASTAETGSARLPGWLRANMAAILDIAERVTIFVLFTNFTLRFYSNFESTGDFVGLLMVVSEVALVVLILVRRKATLVSD